jgi:hypothetical protein
MAPGPDEGAEKDEDRGKDKSDGGTDDPQEDRSGSPKRKKKLKMENRGDKQRGRSTSGSRRVTNKKTPMELTN